jgi:hypothetical protein
MRLSEEFFLDNLIEEFSTFTHLSNKVDCLLRLVDFKKFNDIGMI